MAHIHEKFDFTTSGYVVFNDKLLLIHHKKIGKWLQPGGHIELDEDPLIALRREIKEETGLKQADIEIIDMAPAARPSADERNKQIPIPFDINVHDFDATHRHIDLAYIVKSRTDQLRLEQGAAHNIGWFTKSEMAEKLEEGSMFAYTYRFGLYALDWLRNQ